MSLAVHSILIFNKKAIGVRFASQGKYQDVEIESLKGVKKDHLRGYKTQTLIPKGDLLLTQEEILKSLVVEDMSSNISFCEKAILHLTQEKTSTQTSPLTVQNVAPSRGTAKAKTKTKNMPKGTLKLFEVVVLAPMYDQQTRDFEPREFTCTVEATNALMARKVAKEEYALDFNTEPSEIKIISAKLKE